ncbi:MAG TPA: methyltransferase [Candidatus Dormibacteraeota bacterium]|nr:methyltransferase [Candidatus Dormibacteraeota bacterium]
MGERPPVEAVRLLNGFRGYQLVVAACRLKLPDLVASGHSSPATLAAMTETHEPSLRRMLRGLAAWGFFAEDAEGRVSPTPISESFRSDRPGLRDIALMLSSEGYRAWAELPYALQTGGPVFEHVYGKTRWEKMAEEPQDAALFNAAMVETSRRVGAAFTAGYDLQGVDTVVDVGGGNGALLAAILLHLPHAKGVLFDLSAGLAGAADRMREAGLEERVSFMEGSFFDSVPSGGDLYLLKSIVHDWDDEKATAILACCGRAMDESARLVLVERFADGDSSLATVMSDLHMMLLFGARERTTAEYAALLDAAGLRMTRPVMLDSDFYAIEATRLP